MVTFLFWNVKKRPLENLIARLVHDHRVDVLIIAESRINDADLLRKLNKGQTARYSPVRGLSRRLWIYSRYPSNFIKPILDEEGISVRHICLPLGKKLLLVAVHLPSKLYRNPQDQAYISRRLSKIIRDAESKLGHSQTVLAGDFNMNPFELGVIGAEELHAVMDQRIARKRFRQVQGEKFYFFYNPMWGRIGDLTPGPPGTYYFNTGGQINFFWHIFDQVLIRPDLLDFFQYEELNILEEIGSTLLLTKSGKPNRRIGSDHLPIIFKLNL